MLLNDNLQLQSTASVRWKAGSTGVLLLVIATLSCVTLRPAVAVFAGKDSTDAAASEMVDHYGDPMPPKSVYRLGTRRLRPRCWPYTVAFSPDGSMLATYGGGDEVPGVYLWNVRSGALIRILKRSGRELSTGAAIALSPDGTRCLAAGYDGTIQLWNVDTGKELLRFRPKKLVIGTVAFAPNGLTFATGGGDGFVHVWRAENGEKVHSYFTGDRRTEDPFAVKVTSGLCAMAFSPDNRFLVSGTEGGKIHGFDLKKRQVTLRIPKAHDDQLNSLAITPDGKQLVTGGTFRKAETRELSRGRTATYSESYAQIRFWNISTGKQLRQLDREGSSGAHGAFVLSTDGKILAASYADGIHISDTESGSRVRTIPSAGAIFRTGLALSPDGSMIARAWRHPIALWQVATGSPLHLNQSSHTAAVHCVAYAPDGSLIATGAGDGTARLWDADSGRLVRQFWLSDQLAKGQGAVSVLAFSPDGETLACSGLRGRRYDHPEHLVRIWKTSSGEQLDEFSNPVAPYERMTSLAFNPNGSRLAVAGRMLRNMDDIDIWDLTRGRRKTAELRPPPRAEDLLAMAYLDHRTLCEVRSQPPIIRIWDTINGGLNQEIEVEKHWESGERPQRQKLSDAVITPNFQQVTTCGNDKVITWDLETGQSVSTITLARPAEQRRIGISPDGRLLAVSDIRYGREWGDDTIRLWDRTAGQQVLVLQPDGARAISFAFSPDGRRLVTGMDVGTALVWDITETSSK